MPLFALRRLKAKDAELKAAIRRAELAEAHEKGLESAYGNAFEAEREARLSATRAFSDLEGLIGQLHSRLEAAEAGRAVAKQAKPQTEGGNKSKEEAGQKAQKDPLWFLTRGATNDATTNGSKTTTKRPGTQSLDEILASIRKALAEDAGS